MRSALKAAAVLVLFSVVTARPASAVLLRYTPAVGSATKGTYTMTNKTHTSYGDAINDMSMTMQAPFEVKVLELSTKGRKVQTLMHATKAAMTMTGAGEQGTSQEVPIPESSVTLLVDELGHSQSFTATGLPANVNSDINGVMSNLGGAGGFPEADVTPGSSWTSNIKTRPSGMIPAMDMTVTSRMLELLTYRGHPCAKIGVNIKGTLSMTSPVAMTGQLGGSGVCYFDYQRSVWLDQETQMSMIGSGKLATGAADGDATMTIKTDMTMKLHTIDETTPAPTAPAKAASVAAPPAAPAVPAAH